MQPEGLNRRLAVAAYACSAPVAGKLQHAGRIGKRVGETRIQEGPAILSFMVRRQIVPAKPYIKGQLRRQLDDVFRIGRNRLKPSGQFADGLQTEGWRATDCAQQIAGIGVSVGTGAGTHVARPAGTERTPRVIGRCIGVVGKAHKAAVGGRICVVDLLELIGKAEGQRMLSFQPLDVVRDGVVVRRGELGRG